MGVSSHALVLLEQSIIGSGRLEAGKVSGRLAISTHQPSG
jgi:hypothetical protein